MRVEFSKGILSALANDPRAVLLTGDLGYSAFEDLIAQYPARYLNCGVAEQNMMGVAAGLAMSGFRPWVYSIVPFVTYRCFEQVRNDICLHHLPVHIVGNGGGFTYGVLGTTHHGLEDLGILKTLPNMSLFFPCGNDQVSSALVQVAACETATYLRLAVSPHATAAAPLSENKITLTRKYQSGSRATLVGMGHATQLLLSARAKHGLDTADVDLFSVAKFPFDLVADQALWESAARTGHVIVCEEHYASGGMGESLARELPAGVRCDILAPSYTNGQRYGGAAFHLDQCQMSPAQLTARIEELMRPAHRLARAA